MKRSVVLVAILLSLFMIQIPCLPVAPSPASRNPSRLCSFDLHALALDFKGKAPVMVRFTQYLSTGFLYELQSLGIVFSLGSASMSRIGSYYLIEGSPESIEQLVAQDLVTDIAAQTPSKYAHPTRDVSIPEIKADQVWNMLDSVGRNVTGKGVLVADLDTGVDWTHPDLWFAGTIKYNWIEALPNAALDNGTDCIDLNNDSLWTADEVLYIIDLDRDGIYDVTTDWLWVDNITQDGLPQVGEPFFVTEDADGDGLLDVGEHLLMLTTPKTRYIVEKHPITDSVIVWDRSANLTSTTHEDVDGHGTAVAGILLGGQIGYRQYVGAAPDAELMMLRVLASDNTSLTVEAALAWAFNHGADAILTEIGSWTYHYLDGSSAAETAIDTIVAAGVPVISPSGNLGGKTKHALFQVQALASYQVDFSIPPPGVDFGYDIQQVYITVLSRNSTQFGLCNFSLFFNLATWFAPPRTLYLHPNAGYYNFSGPGDSFNSGGRILTAWSFISVSSRGTSMLGVLIQAMVGLPTTTGGLGGNAPPWHQLNITAPQITAFHAYISDSQTSWTGGAVWISDISDDYHICWPSTADQALSVASYRTRNLVGGGVVGDIASFSSRGPRIDEVLKQGIAAPGGFDIISDYTNASAWSGWYNNFGGLPFTQRFASYRLFSGTSASGPHVAGCAALMLQVNSTAGSDVAWIIEGTATSDAFTQNVPNKIWGGGKLNALAAVSHFDTIDPVIHTVERSPISVEYSQQIVFEANVTDDVSLSGVYLKYQINGWTTPTYLAMSQLPSGNHSATIGPFAYSSDVYFTIYANDTSSNDAETSLDSFTIGDSISPWLGNAARNATAPTENRDVLVGIDATEPASASGIDTVLLNYTTDSWSTFTVILLSGSGNTYAGVIPGQPSGTTVLYRFWANDTAGNVNTTSDFSYTVQDATTTATTTTATTTTTTTTTTTMIEPNLLQLVIMLAIVLLLAVLCAMYDRRRS